MSVVTYLPRDSGTEANGLSTRSRPQLRPVEVIVVNDPREGRLLVLRDTQGIAPGHAALPAALGPIVARFDGRQTCEEIARAASRELGEAISPELVAQLASELDKGLYLQSANFEEARRAVEQEFVRADTRPASHAGGAYYSEPGKLLKYVEEECLARFAQMNISSSASANGAAADGKRIVGLIAPHIDPWRGAVGYGAAYGALGKALDQAPDVDTFLVFGTSHAPMRRPFALCRKAFATPLGPIDADTEAIDAIAEACDFDPYEDQLNHKREHSIEFQAVFLRHALAKRASHKSRNGQKKPATIIPILAGLGDQQTSGRDPSRTKSVERFYGAIRTVMARRPGRVVVVAGADLAHVGPRFGDAKPHDAASRHALEGRDRASMAAAAAQASGDFWRHVAEDLETRRVCGLAPIYSLLRVLDGSSARGELLHYEQTVDQEDGSIVSHAAMTFSA